MTKLSFLYKLPYLKTNEARKTDYFDYSFLSGLIRNFVYTFRSSDHCELNIIIEGSSDTEKTELTCHRIKGLIAELESYSAYNSPPSVIISTQGELEKEIDSIITHEIEHRYHSAAELFHLYRNALHKDYIDEYEFEEVANLYDTDYVLSKQQYDTEYQANLGLLQFAEILDYLLQCNLNSLRICDAGCGTGTFYDYLQRLTKKGLISRPHYHGFDFSRAQVNRANLRFPSIHAEYGSVDQIPFGNNSFDLLISRSVLHLVEPKLQIQSLKEFCRVSENLILNITTTAPESGFSTKGTISTPPLFAGKGSSNFSYQAPYDDVKDIIDKKGGHTLQEQRGFIVHMETENYFVRDDLNPELFYELEKFEETTRKNQSLGIFDQELGRYKENMLIRECKFIKIFPTSWYDFRAAKFSTEMAQISYFDTLGLKDNLNKDSIHG